MLQQNNEPAFRRLSEDIVNKMLKLEQLFHQKYLTVDLLNQLIATYVEVIQCFDGIYTPMRKYFISKIQLVVSQPEIQKLLLRNNKNDNTIDIIRQTVRMTTQINQNQQKINHQMLIEAIQAQNKKYRKLQQKKIKQNKAINRQSEKSLQFQSQDKKYSQRSILNDEQIKQDKKIISSDKKTQFSINLMKEVSQNIKQFEKQDKKLFKQTKRINALMQEQNTTLQARLAVRKKGKNRKKSIDQKFVHQVQQFIPMIQKQELITAQKQIEEAVQRMTARLTQRQGTNKGTTGLILSLGENQTEKYKGRVKMKKGIKRQEGDDMGNSLKVNMLKNKTQKINIQERKQIGENKTSLAVEENNRGARFTLGLKSEEKDEERNKEMKKEQNGKEKQK